MKNWMMNESCVDADEDVDEDVKAQQAPISLSAGGRSFISCATVTHVLYCFGLSDFSGFLYIYKHNYGAIVLGREGCCEV